MNVLTVDYDSPDAPAQFLKSFRETGFAVINHHPVDWVKIEKAYQEWTDFFHDDRRYDYLIDKEKQDGYIPFDISETAKGAEVKDIKEFYHLYYPWGRYPNFISNNTRELFEETVALGKTLLGWLQDELPTKVTSAFQCVLPEMVSQEQTLQRILYYPAMSGGETSGAIRAAAHEDINLITCLPAATQSGLQAKDLAGRWHDIEIGPKTMVINAGDMLQEATAGYVKSTTHRVINPEGKAKKKARMSIPTFIHPHPEVYLSKAYPSAGQYLQERLKELGLI